jgi:hypothetical protein
LRPASILEFSRHLRREKITKRRDLAARDIDIDVARAAIAVRPAAEVICPHMRREEGGRCIDRLREDE